MSRRRSLVIAVAAAVAACVPTAAVAVAPPKSCGLLTAKGKRYQVKADQISCRTARSHVRRYYEQGRRPSGYRCRTNPPSRSAVALYCEGGRKVFFAIRR